MTVLFRSAAFKNIGEIEMSHTPGPWKIFEGCGADKRRPVIVDSIPDVDGKFVGNCICFAASTNPDIEANANLIAAAPEMLEALKMVLQHGRIDDSESRMAMVAAAITKAESGVPRQA
jgi:hypothetical protein